MSCQLRLFYSPVGRLQSHLGLDEVRLAVHCTGRVLPTRGEQHVIAQADGTMICTVAPGPRKGKRPRDWQEMLLVATQAKGRATIVYGATFGSVQETGRRLAIVPGSQGGDEESDSGNGRRSRMDPLAEPGGVRNPSHFPL